MTIQQYLSKINTLYITGNAREHSYRGDLQNLIMAILPDILVTNEPARVACGAPDYVLTRKDVPVGYIEAKDIGVDLGSKTLKEQFERYKLGLSNLVFTDYMDFHFYKDGVLTKKIAIAKLENGTIVPQPENFDQFTQLIKNFAEIISQTIKSPTKLAQMMAGKSKLMADVIEKSLNFDDQEGKRSQLKSQMLSFQQMLIHDIDNKTFADIYAQTIAYGMFAARYHDPTLPTFSRMEAAELIPKSNPFLRKLFQDIAGFDLDTRLTWIVDELVNIFLASDVATIMKNFGRSTRQEDPVVHFYETFLGEYNPALKKARGVWYTPQPVVNFIVRAVDDILKSEFDLAQGLADTSKIKIKKKAITQTASKKNAVIKEVEVEHEVHKVQILDPATGTGTFLAEVVKHIHKKFEGQQGIWSNYVTKDLIPRLNGFELLMASYAMAHLKMDMLLTETGYKPTDDQRFRIFLTNSLEEAHPDTGTLFSSWLSDEADQANAIKRDAPVMVVIGNPPYSGESSNNGAWIGKLIEIYKKDNNNNKIPDTKWLNNDYVKFLRFGQSLIEKNDNGILAFITDNSFLDSVSFRGMRWNLLNTFDKIYTLNLHGNSLKQEKSPDGSLDKNVFDIKQGVSINIFIKKKHKKENQLSKVFYFDLYGRRESKYEFLLENSINQIVFEELPSVEPNYFFVPKDFSSQDEYDTYFKINDIINLNGVGICSKRDDTAIRFSKGDIKNVLNDFKTITEGELKLKYKTESKESRDKKTVYAINNINNFGVEDKFLRKISYRPFDTRWTYFTNKSKGFLAYPVYEVMKHFKQENFGLIVSKKSRQLSLGYMFITNNITDLHILDSAADSTYVYPLYLYPETNGQQDAFSPAVKRIPNLNMETVSQIAKSLGLTFTNEKETESNVCFANSDEVRPELKQSFAPIDLLDYIYAVLHSPTYREKYKEFLKIDFPRVPVPPDNVKFWKLVKLGGELRQIHLLESPTVEKYITQYPEDGDNIVTKPMYKNGNVYINDEQHFANVPEVAWNFYIGGYQPAQKWLKDRKGRELNYDDILHYQKMVAALNDTDRIMKEIDLIKI